MADQQNNLSPRERLAAAARNAAVHALPSYYRFALKALKGSPPYAVYERLRSVFSPAFWLARVLRIARRVFLIIEASAFLVFAAAFLLLTLPVLLLLALAFANAVIHERRRMNRRLAASVTGQRVMVFFGGAGHMAVGTAGYTVLLVTDALPLRHPAAVAYRRADGVIMVREHYFFYLRRTLLRTTARTALLFA